MNLNGFWKKQIYISYGEEDWLLNFIMGRKGYLNVLIDFALSVGENEDLSEVRKKILS